MFQGDGVETVRCTQVPPPSLSYNVRVISLVQNAKREARQSGADPTYMPTRLLCEARYCDGVWCSASRRLLREARY
eukprot:1871848-Rhodomonas_salina.2